MSKTGIDVSCYNGKIDWKKVKAAGIQFAILKVVNKSLKPDSMFETNYKGCNDNGIPVIGVYNYSYATDTTKARADAKQVLKVLNGRKTTVWLDVEDECQMNLKKGKLVEIINAYAEVILKGGCSFGIYTGESEYNNLMKPYGMPAYKMWIARYGKDNGKMDLKYQPHVPNLAGWQYTSKGKVNGIQGDVDMNVWYDELKKKYVNPYTEPTRLIYNKTPMMKGSDVKWVQAWLVQKGFFKADEIDGVYGPKTDSAVRAFQKSVGITVDGKVGVVTIDYLKR